MRRAILIIIILLFTTGVSAQKRKDTNKNMTAKEGAKIQAKKKKEREDKVAAEYKERVDRHKAIQDKQTQKRMKANAKRSKQMDPFYRPPFYKRWFGKKRR